MPFAPQAQKRLVMAAKSDDGEVLRDVEANPPVNGVSSIPPKSKGRPLPLRPWSPSSVFWVAVRVVVVLVGLYTLTVVIPSHGTFFPFFTERYLSRYTPPKGMVYDRPFQPQSRPRVVVTLSTLPNRLPMIHETIQTLIDQDRRPDAIYVNIPLGTHKRSGLEYFIPEKVQAMPEVTVLRPDADVGPLTKLAPALVVETDPETIVITVDDDKYYPPDLVSTLERYSLMDPSAAFGACGWGFMWWPRPKGVVNAYAPFVMRGSFGLHVDVLQAVCGNAYRRGHFGQVEDLLNFPKVCLTVDDVWIAGYIDHRGVDRVLIPDRMEMKDTAWKSNEKAAFKLNYFNRNNGIHIKCVDEVERLYGPWRLARDRGVRW